ncbi:ATP-dependent RecD-like DNA helicase [Microvirga tunisiensis]|uniref:ATP-dependent RecD2 DNA helicase n=1 Tax=Microvirga tunisiensis TaxID=2108360 RepID=A0A5N7MB25_9HYPH|nr:ATP-dependent RecD-like DNA helicase [Microvirga tunisiensis]MPR06327.1 ATP-dependent RecD-like DNA helicase [Microvirga tunisiensis]MPR24113.1 ATP-dependent RecD-like DNA helicase [Microvirga tunisiensis]
MQSSSVPAQLGETLAGTIERIVFHKEDSGFAVLRVRARGQRDLTTLVGFAPSLIEGEQITAVGNWHNDRSYGLQFKASSMVSTPPTGAAGIEKYLGSGLIKGIGPEMAKRIVKTLGPDALDIIDTNPEFLLTVKGIGKKRAEQIMSGWAEQKAIRDIMVFLHAHGVGTARAARIYKTYGQKAVKIMSENPYRLAKDIRGIGFRSADQIAQRLGFTKDDPRRLRAGVTFALSEATSDGHCGLPVDMLLDKAVELLEAPRDLLKVALTAEINDGDIVQDQIQGRGCVFTRRLHQAEDGIAEKLLALLDGSPPWKAIDPDKAIGWAQTKTGKDLSNSQKEALRLVLRSKVTIVTGGPGVGKTTLLDTTLKILAQRNITIALAAPTGRAAKRITEQTGLEAKTVHRLLEVQGSGFKRDETNPLECDLLVVDETSMLDVNLMLALVRALPKKAALLLVGDIDQLPSVGPGAVLGDLIGSKRIPVARLTEVFRQAASSRIITNAHRINQGEMPVPPAHGEASDFYIWPVENPEEGVTVIVNLVSQRIPGRFWFDPKREIQLLCPMQRGDLGARNLNIEIQKVINPPNENSIERFGWKFTVGDRIMQTVNDYDRDVFNGDLGIVDRIDHEEKKLFVKFDNVVEYPFDELDVLTAAYATTIHKSQGSEYPVVVIPMATQHYMMLARNLLYTGVTRGKQLVIVVGQKKAISMAVRNDKQNRRWTRLQEILENT